MTREYRAGHRIGGVHHVRLRHRKGRDIVGDRIEVLSVAGSLRRPGGSATNSGNKRKSGDGGAMRIVHQSFRSEGGLLGYCRESHDASKIEPLRLWCTAAVDRF